MDLKERGGRVREREIQSYKDETAKNKSKMMQCFRRNRREGLEKGSLFRQKLVK